MKTGDINNRIAESFADFTLKHYELAVVVFDGYTENPYINDNTYLRRGHNLYPIVSFTPETVFSGKKEEFLARDINKSNMIGLISNSLERRGCNVLQSKGDANVNIVRTTVKKPVSSTTTLIGEDTDLLILLLYYTKPNNNIIYFRSDIKSLEKNALFIILIK